MHQGTRQVAGLVNNSTIAPIRGFGACFLPEESFPRNLQSPAGHSVDGDESAFIGGNDLRIYNVP
jgi:hypothetical protein